MLELISLAISDNDISSVLEAIAVLNLVQPEQIFAKSEQFRKSYLVEVSVSLIKHRDYKSVSIALGAKVPARQIIWITFICPTYILSDSPVLRNTSSSPQDCASWSSRPNKWIYIIIKSVIPCHTSHLSHVLSH